jgi:class 3 adenylate cyclase
VKALDKTWIPLALAVLVAVLSAFVYDSLSGHWHPRERQATDAGLVASGERRFAKRPVREDIVLVMFDVSSATKLGKVHNHENDIKVYRKLVQAQAAVIYDSRMIASASEEDYEIVKPVLDTLLELDGSPLELGRRKLHSFRGLRANAQTQFVSTIRVMRDVGISPKFVERAGQRVMKAVVHNPISSRPHALPAHRSRLYPLAYSASTGSRESAPLAIARHLWGFPVASPEEVGQELLRCGVLTRWHEAYPERVMPTNEPISPYQLGDQEIVWEPFAVTTPLIPPAGFRVCDAPQAMEFRQIPFADILTAESMDDFDLAGKVILIGFTLETHATGDRFEIPGGLRQASSVEVLAMATQTLLDHRILRPLPPRTQLLLLVLTTFAATLAGAWTRPLMAVLLLFVILAFYFLIAMIVSRIGWEFDFMALPVVGLIGALVGISYHAWSSHRTHSKVVDLFGRYVPRAVVSQLILRPELEALQVKGTKREISIVFADIRGFTRFAELLPPERVVEQLNSLLEVMVECTFNYEGTLDKFIGDAILVLFNAPLDQPDHLTRAVSMTLEMQHRLRQHGSGLSVGIGLHVGQAVVGTIGTPQRMEYTAIGNSVNIASRLCDVAASGTVVVSEAVKIALGDQYAFTSLGPVEVKGIRQAISVWRIDSLRNSSNTEENLIQSCPSKRT